MSVKDIGDGWVEYWFYYGNSHWPSDGTYRYNEALGKLLLLCEINIETSKRDEGGYILKLENLRESFMDDKLQNLSVLSWDEDAWLLGWTEVRKEEHPDSWEFFFKEKAKNEQQFPAAYAQANTD